jgi:hypothetical protein
MTVLIHPAISQLPTGQLIGQIGIPHRILGSLPGKSPTEEAFVSNIRSTLQDAPDEKFY